MAIPRQVPCADDVFSGVLTRLKAQASYPQLFPQGTWQGKRPGNEAGTGTYAVMTIDVGDQENVDSAYTYTQKFTVEITAWVASDPKTSLAPQTAPVAQFFDQCLNWTEGNNNAGITVPNATQTLLCHPTGGRLKLSDDLRRSRDIFLCGKRVEITIEGHN